MAEKILMTRFQLLCDSTANWASNGAKVLLKGEPGIELLENGKAKIKIGTGNKSWAELDYVSDAVKIEELEKVVEGILDNLGLLEERIAKTENDISTLQSVVGSSADATGIFAELNKKANAADVYTKSEVDGLVSTVYNYCGSKANYSDLPVEGNKIGDVWNITNADILNGINAGDNVAWNGTGWDRLAGIIDLSGYATVQELTAVKDVVNAIPALYLSQAQAVEMYEARKYQITDLPTGSTVNYGDKEIRVFCPKDAVFVKQNVGPTGNANMYYMTFRAYAPEAAVSFKEDDSEIIADQKMYTFTSSDNGGIDAYGRKYSVCWLALASYDPTTDTWTYFGKNSKKEKYIGWYYSVEWYDVNGNLIDSDCIRINLSNEDCHNTPEPYYMYNINVNRLTQTEGDDLILFGGDSTL